jgi:O-antigen ligase
MKDSYLLERFKHIHTLSYELDAPVSDFNELTSRLALAECSWMIIEKNLFFGVGIGDVTTELNKIYTDVDFKPGYLDRLNPHNEYLSHWLSVGIFGLGTLIVIFVLCFLAALKRRNYLFLIIVCIFFISFVFESMLERNKGVVLFAFLLPLFYNTKECNIFNTKHDINE